MKKVFKLNRYLLIPFFALSLSLVGCSGDDGSTGPTGAPGADGTAGPKGDDATTIIPGSGVAATYAVPAHASSPQIVGSQITAVTVNPDGTITVDFTVSGITSTVAAEFTIAKWLPADNSWIGMLQRSVTNAEVPGSIPVVRGGNLRPAALTAAGGVFSYTFSSGGNIDFRNGAFWTHAKPTGTGDYGTYVDAIVADIDAKGVWDSNAIYRVGVTSRQTERFTAIAYVRGDGTPVAAVDAPKQGITAASCVTCHGGNDGQLSIPAHSNRRNDPQLCTSCHNNFTYDSASSVAVVGGWAPIDLMTMIHKIHSGIDGYTVAGYDFSDVSFPDWTFGRGTGPKNCAACHQGDVPAVNTSWNTVSLKACATCHVDRAAGGTNPFHQVASDCTGCHIGNGLRSAEQFHGISTALADLATARDYVMEVVSVENAVAGQQAKVTWRVAKGGVYQDLFTGTDTYANGVRVSLGWGHGDDFTNDGSGNSSNGDAGRPVQVVMNPNVDTTNTVAGTDNTYAVTTFGALPAAATDGRFGFVALERGPVGINVSSTVKTFALGADAVSTFGERRQIVSAENCNACHTTVSRHGAFADVDVATCVTCHNAGSLSRDASVVQGTVDLMYIVHALHSVGGEIREKFDRRYDHEYGYVTYPRTILDCNACHVNGSENAVDTGKRLGVIANGGKALYEAGTGVNSPFASVCYSCHQDNDETARAHFVSQGANMLGNATHAEYVAGQRAESCKVCH